MVRSFRRTEVVYALVANTNAHSGWPLEFICTYSSVLAIQTKCETGHPVWAWKCERVNEQGLLTDSL